MKYMGSKARIAKDISPIINKLIQENGITVYIEPFVGGSNMIQHIQCENKYGYDNNEYLIEFWKKIQNGWNPLTMTVDITKERYQDIKNNMGEYPKHIVALAGFCATYNAKWFGGYAGTVKTKNGTYRNYYDEAVRNVLKQCEHIKDVHYKCFDYQQIDVEGAVIYCDPPYQGTTGYKNLFCHETYWDWVRKMSKKNIVICSEYNAPTDFECIWQKELTTTLDKSSRSKAVEKLFVLKKEKEIKQMELKVNEVTLPEQITFNYEELKQELTAKVSMYETLVYTDEQIKDAKADKANLNKLKKALNDERIRLEKNYMQPFNDFKTKINEIIGIIDKPVAVIDKQVKEYEDKKKKDKKEQIELFFAEQIELAENATVNWLKLTSIFNEKWLNASVSMKSIQEDIKGKLEQIANDLDTLSNLPEFGFEATEVYKTTLDINKALNEGKRLAEIARKKAEHEAEMKARAEEQAKSIKPEPEQYFATGGVISKDEFAQAMNPPVEEAPAKQWVAFKCLLTVEDAQALGQFMRNRNIQFEQI